MLRLCCVLYPTFHLRLYLRLIAIAWSLVGAYRLDMVLGVLLGTGTLSILASSLYSLTACARVKVDARDSISRGMDRTAAGHGSICDVQSNRLVA
jgi:hypothetical protein